MLVVATARMLVSMRSLRLRLRMRLLRLRLRTRLLTRLHLRLRMKFGTRLLLRLRLGTRLNLLRMKLRTRLRLRLRTRFLTRLHLLLRMKLSTRLLLRPRIEPRLRLLRTTLRTWRLLDLRPLDRLRPVLLLRRLWNPLLRLRFSHTWPLRKRRIVDRMRRLALAHRCVGVGTRLLRDAGPCRLRVPTASRPALLRFLGHRHVRLCPRRLMAAVGRGLLSHAVLLRKARRIAAVLTRWTRHAVRRRTRRLHTGPGLRNRRPCCRARHPPGQMRLHDPHILRRQGTGPAGEASRHRRSHDRLPRARHARPALGEALGKSVVVSRR